MKDRPSASFLQTCLVVIPIMLLVSLPPALGWGAQEATTTQVVLLGTGAPPADPERSGPCTAIISNGVPYLVDFGPGVIRRAAAAQQAGIEALRIKNLKRAFLTHLHSDHTVGYPDLILSGWSSGREEPLQVYGPEGLRAMTEHVLAAYEQDVYMRLFGPQTATKEGYKVIAHEIKPGIVYQDTRVTVEAFAVHHGSWPSAFGYKFTTPDRTIVLSGDTSPSGSVVEACNGCDVLLHEVYSEAAVKNREGAQRYFQSFHTSTSELAEIASKAKPKLLILYHQMFLGEKEEDLLAEIRRLYSGKVVSGRDLDVY